jgi:hypothetical protein
MTEEKMRAFCKEVVPEIEKIKEIMEKHGIETRIGIHIDNADDHISLTGDRKEFEDWDLAKFNDEPYKMWHHNKRILLDKE